MSSRTAQQRHHVVTLLAADDHSPERTQRARQRLPPPALGDRPEPDRRHRLTENGTILHPGIDPWATDSAPTARQIRAFLRPRNQAFAALMDQYAIRANGDDQYEDTDDALDSTEPLGRWVAVLVDETYFRIVNTRSATAACDALAAIGQEYLGLPRASRSPHRRCRPRHPHILSRSESPSGWSGPPRLPVRHANHG